MFELLSMDKTRLFYKTSQALHPRDLAGISSGGGGVAAGDINNDGLPDLLFSGGIQNSGLFLNEGDFRFKDITKSAGLVDYREGDAFTECVNLVDINGDGWLDIYITKLGIAGDFKTGNFNDFGANLLFINNKDLTFTESAKEYGLDLIGQTVAAQFFDYDNDGDLDVYLIQGSEPGSTFSFSYYQKKPAFKWFRDMLLENQKGAQFVDVTEKAGLLDQRNIGLSISIADVNNDGYQDIYIANDFLGRDYFYLNKGDKTFEESFHQYFTKCPMSSMGSDFSDVDDDGYEDLFVGEMMPATYQRQKMNLVPFSIEVYEQSAKLQAPQYTRNMLFKNFKGERMRDLGLYANVFATEWSWSSFFLDVDLDGRKDLFVPNGIRRDMTNMDFVKSNFGDQYTEMSNPEKQSKANIESVPSVTTPNYIFKNAGNFQFDKMNDVWGLSEKVHTRGATYADLDNDGDLEIILSNLDQPPSIYKNLAREQTKRNYFKLRLKGEGQNSFGIGAKVEIRTATGDKYFYTLKNQLGFQSTPEPLIQFGLGKLKTVDTLLINWPSGKKSIHLSLATNTTHTIEESQADNWQAPPPSKAKMFEERKLFDYVHVENNFNDFKYERLTPWMYSKQGPRISVGDLTQDGLPDIYITGTKEKQGELFVQQTGGTFSPIKNQAGKQSGQEESIVKIADWNGDGKNELYLAFGTNEKDAPISHQVYALEDGKEKWLPFSDLLPDIQSVIASVATADIDGDGDQDLFLGGCMKSGAFGVTPRSYLFFFENGRYVPAPQEWSKDLEYPGMVHKALFSDINGDQKPDLILAGEWMPIQVFINQGQSFEKQSIPNSEGLWHTLESADLDGDGDLDLVAGNLGENHFLKAAGDSPLTLLAGDFDQNGTLDPVIFYYEKGLRGVFPNRDLFVSQMPVMNNKYYNFSKYAEATYETMFTEEERAKAKTSHVVELESALFINEGESWGIKKLPALVQTTNIEAILIYDFNEDGLSDLLLAGNSNQNHFEYGDMDASDGFLLWGSQDGTFQARSASDYGLNLSGFVRDLDIVEVEGSPVLVVGNNSGATQFYDIR